MIINKIYENKWRYLILLVIVNIILFVSLFFVINHFYDKRATNIQQNNIVLTNGIKKIQKQLDCANNIKNRTRLLRKKCRLITKRQGEWLTKEKLTNIAKRYGLLIRSADFISQIRTSSYNEQLIKIEVKGSLLHLDHFIKKLIQSDKWLKIVNYYINNKGEQYLCLLNLKVFYLSASFC